MKQEDRAGLRRIRRRRVGEKREGPEGTNSNRGHNINNTKCTDLFLKNLE
jgi:hypothetical protein